ncbi:MAG TPA: aldo/keto reductase [Ktedonobacterales bacterium]
MGGAAMKAPGALGQMRPLGSTGIQVSAVGQGTWAMGAKWGPQDDQESLGTLHHALDLGCQFLDTAQEYGDGRSEQLIGRAFQERGATVPVGTKVPPIDMNWETTPGVTPIREKFPAQYLIDRCEVSLRNLHTECLDVYYLHTWCPSWNEETEWYEAMLKLRKQGKIKGIGISVSDARPAEANGSIQAGRVDVVQMIYNILDQRAATEVFPVAQQHHVGIVARVPLASGALTGTWTPETTFPIDDWRHDVFVGKTLERSLHYIDHLRFLEHGSSNSMAEAAVRFSFSDQAVSSVIPGARSPQEAEWNMQAWQRGPLPEPKLQRIQELWQREFRHFIRTSFYPVT